MKRTFLLLLLLRLLYYAPQRGLLGVIFSFLHKPQFVDPSAASKEGDTAEMLAGEEARRAKVAVDSYVFM